MGIMSPVCGRLAYLQHRPLRPYDATFVCDMLQRAVDPFATFTNSQYNYVSVLVMQVRKHGTKHMPYTGPSHMLADDVHAELYREKYRATGLDFWREQALIWRVRFAGQEGALEWVDAERSGADAR